MYDSIEAPKSPEGDFIFLKEVEVQDGAKNKRYMA